MRDGYIRLGDPTTSGGKVVSASGFPSDGIPVALVDDLAECSTHGGVFKIVGGDSGFISDGRPIATERLSRLECGCGLIATGRNGFWLSEGTPTAHRDARAFSPAAPARHQPMRLVEQRPSDQLRTQVALRIGVFHDGTGNNAGNVAAGTLCYPEELGIRSEEEKEAFLACLRERGIGYESYEKGESNIARLHDLYTETPSLEQARLRPDSEGRPRFCVRVYAQGPATRDGEGDSVIGSGLGRGETGVLAKVDEALVGIKDAFKRIREGTPGDIEVASIEFDIFGFSRGAAAARHLANLTSRKGMAGPVGHALRDAGAVFKPGFSNADVKLRFIGVFDTVAALAGVDDLDPSDARNRGVMLYLAPGCADRVVHLTARDEIRANFALNSLEPGFTDIALPGVHSDIGGGYRPQEWESALLTPPVGYEEAEHVPVKASRAWHEADRHADRWRGEGWIGEDNRGQIQPDAWEVVFQKRDLHSGSALTRRVRKVYAQARMTRVVQGAYSLAILRVMHALATDAGVPFERSPDDVPALAQPDELRPITDKLIAHARRGGGTLMLAPQDEALLRRHYLHYNANWRITEGIRNGPEFTFAFRPTDSGKRTVHGNKPD